MPEKLTEALTHEVFTKVTFTGPFPIDMLRYDDCRPVRERDSHLIAGSLDLGEPAVPRTVYLKKYWGSHTTALDHSRLWTERRWKSFGIHIDLEPVDRLTDIPSDTEEPKKK